MDTLIIEDGTMPEGANSYASITDADAYLVPRGLWPADNGEEQTAKKTAALLRAADYLNTLQWIGDSVDAMRLMAWPRQGDGLTPGLVPPQVKAACIELAGLIYGGRDVLAPLARGGMILAESHSLKAGDVDVIGGDAVEDSFTYAGDAPKEDYLPSVVGILRPLLREVPGKPAGIFLAGIVRG